ncbi:MAG: class I SAM-dependent methyltransferase [Tumebacillaceae bacterium]
MNQVVKDALDALLQEKGKITFAEFMETALYHPTHGYYNRPEMTIGEGGDFYTSPMVHPIFGACISRQVWEFWNLLGKPDPFFVLEMGAGVGTLAADFLQNAQQNAAFYNAIRYHIVEQGAVLQERQRALAVERGVVEKITWYSTLDEVAAQGEQVGVIFSNELFDALPVHRLEKREDGYVEYFIEADFEGYREVEGELSDPKLLHLLTEMSKGVLQPGDRFEVCPAAGDVIRAMGRLLKKGFVLTIDYGDIAPDIHLAHNRRDGLRAYYKQKLVEPLERVGEQDLTADVDFTLLMHHGKDVGLEEIGFTTQMHLLGGNGILRKVKELESRKFDLMADAEMYRILRLFVPQSLGDVFKVLIQGKEVDVDACREHISALTFELPV